MNKIDYLRNEVTDTQFDLMCQMLTECQLVMGFKMTTAVFNLSGEQFE